MDDYPYSSPAERLPDRRPALDKWQKMQWASFLAFAGGVAMLVYWYLLSGAILESRLTQLPSFDTLGIKYVFHLGEEVLLGFTQVGGMLLAGVGAYSWLATSCLKWWHRRYQMPRDFVDELKRSPDA